MKIIKAFSGGYMILAMSIWQAPAPGWRAIVPLHSTRADVERLLGAPGDSCRCQYKTSSELVRIDYSIERCGKGERSTFNIPPDTVLGITLHPKAQPLFCELGLDITKLKKTEDPELRGYFAYTNNDDGIEYNVTIEGR